MLGITTKVFIPFLLSVAGNIENLHLARRTDECFAVQHHCAMLVGADGFHAHALFLDQDFNHFHRGRDGIADGNQGLEIESLLQVYTAWSRQLGTQQVGDKTGRQHAVGDAGFKCGFFGIGLIDMSWIKIPGYSGIKIDIRLIWFY